jgi:hypothetical protein
LKAPEYTVAVPLVVGSDPSVVYLMFATPDPPSEAESVTATGEWFVQPLAQAPPSHWMLVLGAVPSAVTVNDVALEVRPALFAAVTLLGSAGSAAELKLYVSALPVWEPVQPLPRAGNE